MSLIKGIDISNNNGNVSISGSGAKAVIMKASEGTSFKDSYLSDFYSQCKSAGVKTGAYHFLTNTNPESQALNFYNAIKSYSFDCVVLDVESSFTSLNDYVQRFITAFSSYSSQELILYTYTGFLSNLNTTTLKMFSKAWIANYNNLENLTSVANSSLLSAGITIVGHQYSSTGSMGSFTGDLNVFSEDMFSESVAEGTWEIDSTGWWFKYSDGTYPIGWARLPYSKSNSTSYWFLFDSKGYMLTSWQKDGGNWYLLDDENGDMKTGWNYIKSTSKWFYLNDDGVMQVGWIQLNNKWYYLNKDGSMATGWITDGGKNYLLYSSGIMAQNTTAYGYKFASDGVATKL